MATASVVVFALTGSLGQAAELGNTDELWRLLIFISAVVGIEAIAAFINALILGRFGGRVGYSFRRNFANYFLRLPYKKLEQTNSGDNLSIFSNDIPQAVQFASERVLRMIANIFLLIASFIFMMTLNSTFTWIFFGMFPVLTVMQILMSLPIQKKSKTMLEKQGEYNAVVNDSLQNVATITAYGLEDVMEKRYSAKYENFITAVRKFILTMLPLVLFGVFASNIPFLVINVIAGAAVIDGYMYLGEFIAFLAAALMASQWLSMLTQMLQWTQETRAGAVRFNENTAQSLDDSMANQARDNNVKTMAFENVNFSYTDDEDAVLALDDVSFTINQGSRVAFVGGSGSGKSTVLKLLLGLYEPNSGKITAGGRETFAYVPQDSFMFPESIGQNIACSDTPDMDRLHKVCADAGILDFINSLPEKFDTVLAESAENVSGGQRQRIALARAFYRDTPVVLFDEATSALDPITEAQVLEAFDKLAQGKTVIMVAHRGKAIATCDTVITMDGGKVVSIEEGGQ